MADSLSEASSEELEPAAPQSFYYFPGWCIEPKTQLERRIDALTRALRSKPDWQRKCEDPEIVARWCEEALGQDVSAEMFDFAMQARLIPCCDRNVLQSQCVSVAARRCSQHDCLHAICNVCALGLSCTSMQPPAQHELTATQGELTAL